MEWLPHEIARTAVSEPLRRSLGSSGTVVKLDEYAEEIAALLGPASPKVVVLDSDVEPFELCPRTAPRRLHGVQLVPHRTM